MIITQKVPCDLKRLHVIITKLTEGKTNIPDLDQRRYSHIVSLNSVNPHGPFIPYHVSRQFQSPRDHLAL